MIGGALALSGMTGLTLGKLASFLTFNRTLNMPISQISMQFNAIIMALAGGQRIFDLLDESRKWTRARSCWSTPNACRMIL